MADMMYRLVVDLSTSGSLVPNLGRLDTTAKNIGGSLGKLKDGVGSLASGMANAFVGVGDKLMGIATTLGTLGAGAALAGITAGLVGVNNEAEKTKISLASIFSAQGAARGMTDGLNIASAVMKDMRKDAAMLPGEFSDLLNFMRLGATPGLQAGASVKQLEKLSAQGMAAAAATGVDMHQAAREYAMLLQGRAGAHNVFGTMLGFSGAKAEAFNKMAGAERLKAIETELQKYQGSIEVFGKSFDALTSTMKDNAKVILQRMTGPLFDRVKATLSDANKWFDDHQDQVLRFADRIGDALGHAFDVGKRKIEEWGPPLLAFARTARAEFGHILKHAEKVAVLYAGLKAGKVVSPMLSPLISGVGSMMGGGSGMLGALGIGELATGAAVLAPLAIAAAGAAHILADKTNYFHDAAMKAVVGIEKHAVAGFEHLGKAVEPLTPAFIKLADLGGIILLQSLENTAFIFEKGAQAAEFFLKPLGDIIRLMGLAPAHVGDPRTVASDKQGIEFAHAVTRDLDNVRARTKTGAGGGGGGTNIQKVEIVVSSNQDPSRIARLTVDEIKRLNRYPTSSPGVTNFSGANR